MSRKTTQSLTYDDVVLRVLGYEFPSSDKRDSELKIKQRLKYRKLGAYDQTRVALLRTFKDAIQAEVLLCQKSQYFTASLGKYADLRDFDRARMRQDYAKLFPKIPQSVIKRFVDFSVFTYYVR